MDVEIEKFIRSRLRYHHYIGRQNKHCFALELRLYKNCEQICFILLPMNIFPNVYYIYISQISSELSMLNIKYTNEKLMNILYLEIRILLR